MFGTYTTILTGYGQVCSDIPEIAKATNLQYLLAVTGWIAMI